MITRPRIYLAGPDVFRRDASEVFARLVVAGERLGLQALAPSDGIAPAWVPDDQVPRSIFETNMALLRSANGVIANLAPFRGGTEPDSGTVFEVGAAIAMGLPVVGYGARGAYADQVMTVQPLKRVEGVLRDPDDLIVEDFGLPMNLMLACSVQLAGSAEEALKVLAGLLGAAKRG
jgi:nucleoside 2-deoxyribosyltransferase